MVVGQEVRVLDIEQSDKSTPRVERNYLCFVKPDFGQGEDAASDDWRRQTSENVEIANKCR